MVHARRWYDRWEDVDDMNDGWRVQTLAVKYGRTRISTRKTVLLYKYDKRKFEDEKQFQQLITTRKQEKYIHTNFDF